MVYRAKPLAGRFWPKVDCRGPDECWPWTASCRRSGHGQIAIGSTTIGAHRASWIIHHGPVPEGLFVCHHCDNPPCVNPAHLFLGTHDDNMADMRAKSRGVVPAPAVMRGTVNPNSKIDEATVSEIRRRRQSGETVRSVAASVGLSPAQISRIANGKRWAHLDLDLPQTHRRALTKLALPEGVVSAL